MKKAILLLLIPLLSGHWLFSQINHGGSPAVFPQFKSASLEQDVVYMSGFSNPDTESIQAQIAASKHKSLKFAHTYPVDLSPENSGSWYNLPNGQRVWKLKIVSEGAKSINIIFSQFELPEGGMLFVYNPDKSTVRGGFNHLNNKENGVLPIMPVPGDVLIVEYQEPLLPNFEANLVIGSVNHDYIGILGGLKVGDFGDAQPCEVDVNCLGTSILTKRGVLKMIVGGSEVCTGSLVNNTARNGRNYVLSAAHPFQEVNYNAGTTLFIFNYQCPFCSTPDIEGTREQSVAGADMKAYSPDGPGQNIDFSLMELSVNPPNAYRPVYLGWDVRETVPNNTYCIHHPVGDVKKISVDDDEPKISSINIGGIDYYANGHFLVEEWESGATEPGSSGSPLFNNRDQIVGGLSAGLADCQDPTIDYFFRISKAWDAFPRQAEQLKHWLDPSGTGEELLEVYVPEDVGNTIVLTNVKNEDALEVSRLRNEASGFQAGHNSFKILEYAEKMSSPDLITVLGVYFVPYVGRWSGENKLKLKVWSGTDYPKDVLYEKDVDVSEWLRNQTVDNDNFGTTGGYNRKTSYNDQQNYIPLEERLTVRDNFFVGFQISYEGTKIDTFALYQTNFAQGERENTAYYNDGLEWLPFTSYPVSPANTSLWIDVVGQTTDNPSVGGPDFTFQNFVIWPNPANQLDAKISVSDSIKTRTEVKVYSNTGALVLSSFIPAGLKVYRPDLKGLISGIYMIQFISGDRRELHKLSLIQVDDN